MDALLNINFVASQIFWLVVSFTLLLIVMWKFVTPVLTQTLDERARQIREDLEKAEALKVDAEETLASYKKQLEKAQAEASDLIATARQDAEDLTKERLDVLNTEIKRRQAQAEEAIAQAEAKAMEEMRVHIAELTILATEKAIGEKLTAKKAEAFTDKALEELNA